MWVSSCGLFWWSDVNCQNKSKDHVSLIMWAVLMIWCELSETKTMWVSSCGPFWWSDINCQNKSKDCVSLIMWGILMIWCEEIGKRSPRTMWGILMIRCEWIGQKQKQRPRGAFWWSDVNGLVKNKNKDHVGHSDDPMWMDWSKTKTTWGILMIRCEWIGQKQRPRGAFWWSDINCHKKQRLRESHHVGHSDDLMWTVKKKSEDHGSKFSNGEHGTTEHVGKKSKDHVCVSLCVCVLGGWGKLEEKADYVFAMCVCLGGGGGGQLAKRLHVCLGESTFTPCQLFVYSVCFTRWEAKMNGMWSSCGQPSHCIGCAQPSPCIGCGQPSGQASDCICCCQPSCCICLGGGVCSSLS